MALSGYKHEFMEQSCHSVDINDLLDVLLLKETFLGNLKLFKADQVCAPPAIALGATFFEAATKIFKNQNS